MTNLCSPRTDDINQRTPGLLQPDRRVNTVLAPQILVTPTRRVIRPVPARWQRGGRHRLLTLLLSLFRQLPGSGRQQWSAVVGSGRQSVVGSSGRQQWSAGPWWGRVGSNFCLSIIYYSTTGRALRTS